jgi:L-amino acid N-acyltransferase YncA
MLKGMGRGDADPQAALLFGSRTRHVSSAARSRRAYPAPVVIADAEREDIPELAVLMREVAKRTYSPAHDSAELVRWLQENCSQSHFRYRVGRSGYRVLVARDPASGQIIGMGTLRQRGNRADISGVYVRDSGRGVGSQVLKQLETVACELGCVRARASVWRTNEPSKEFFKRRGLRKAGGYREQTVGVMVDHYEGDLPLRWGR